MHVPGTGARWHATGEPARKVTFRKIARSASASAAGIVTAKTIEAPGIKPMTISDRWPESTPLRGAVKERVART